jgi:hypothetical protein
MNGWEAIENKVQGRKCLFIEFTEGVTSCDDVSLEQSLEDVELTYIIDLKLFVFIFPIMKRFFGPTQAEERAKSAEDDKFHTEP